jgi:ATP-dependent Lhr-like helicase
VRQRTRTRSSRVRAARARRTAPRRSRSCCADLPWLLAPRAADLAPPRQVLAFLEQRGASFAADIARACGLLPAAVEEALWTLVAHGLVTGDGVAGLRALIDKSDDGRRARTPHAARGRGASWAAGRCCAPPASPSPASPPLLRRWG